MKVAVPKEIASGERRVSLVPETVAKFVSAKLEVLVEAGAGEQAGFPDTAYQEAGAAIVADTAKLYQQAELVLKIQKPLPNQALGKHEMDLLPKGSALVAFLQPLTNPDLVKQLAERGVTAFSMDAIPRITRAQSMDALSSMSTVAGYKAVLTAANALPRFFPMFMTAAGTVRPAKAMVLGAGVAGLQAIATAKRLGAVVEAFDVRPVVREQVQSLGARFLEVDLGHEDTQDAGGYAKELSPEHVRLERELIHKHVKDADVVITTALIPGKPAPVLVTEEMVKDMKPGSVIVDLASEAGGNCPLSKAGEDVVRHGVLIMGPLNLPASLPYHASQMYSRNMAAFLLNMVKEGELNLNFEDEIIRDTCLTHEGKILHEQTRAKLEGASVKGAS
ncbi:MAG: Re/Si-specific NAD(P)(+) transhydrogenase subunit alpha [Armatimonadetes bacterium]|nr:Re/Si-specific NAD(P)(+) transhydrogenase subunit alpha [Armatimonadota bacterium]